MQVSGELEGLTALTQGETEQLLFTIQSSLQIRRRYQFYIWAQSRLNAMVPHDVLICAHHDPLRRGLSFDCFPMFPVSREALDRLYLPATGLMARVVDYWNQAERSPCASDGAGGAVNVELLADALSASGMREFVAHGMPSPHDVRGIETFFCFAQAGDALVPAHIKHEVRPLTARHSFMLELLLPYLHATYHRIVGAERLREPARAEQPGADLIITEREMEILGWVREGKSNQEIGDLLVISPLTVKNHVQKILRKLGASNRAQAVSKAISLGLIANTVTGV
jgi:transcriptional regulator EpsA